MSDFDQPLWTHCRLTLAGPQADLARWRAAFERSPVNLDFAMVYPGRCPDDSMRGIRHWREHHFGFSGALYLRFPRRGEPVEYQWLTRPAPPVPWLRRVATAWPMLDFKLAYTVGGIREQLVLPATVSADEPAEVAGRVGLLALAA